MARVKSRILSEPEAERAKRVVAIRERLGRPRKAFTQEELHDALQARFKGEAPSLRTVKRWEQFGQISSEDAIMLAELAECDVGWLLTGRGTPLGASPALVRKPTGGPDTEEAPSDAEYFAWAAEAARRLLGTEATGIPTSVLLKLLEVTEKDAAERFGARAHDLAGEIRTELERRHGLRLSGRPADP